VAAKKKKIPCVQHLPHPSKCPSIGYSPELSKIPKSAHDPQSYYNSKPAWRISMMEMEDPYGWHKIDATTLYKIRAHLKNLESMTWSDILVKAKKQNHLISKNKISSNAQKRLLDIKQDDIDELLSLRLTGKERIYGIMEGGIAKLLWWDPFHKVCPSELRHT